ncbi:MAG: hypothetical protein FJ276_37105, partial [Planctomycetes bacterium]|nr:hypothetical protein [Planctomycetota bacterium]
MLTGHPPFHRQGPHGSHLTKMLAHLEKEPTPVREARADVPPKLADVLRRMMAKKPENRLATAAEVVEALQPFCDGSDLPALLARAQAADNVKGQTPSPPAESPSAAQGRDGAQTAARRWRRIPTAVAVAAALFGMVALGIIIRIRHKDGSETVVRVPADAQVIIETESDSIPATVPPQAPTKPDRSVLPVQPPAGTDRAGVATGEPIGLNALVMSPALLPGVKAWTLETREDRAEVLALAYSPDGKWLASGSGDGTIRIRKSDTGEVVRLLCSQTAHVYRLAWSPDGQFLASVGTIHDHAKMVEVWHVESARAVCSNVQGGITVLSWSPDSKALIYTCNHYTACVSDVLSASKEPTWIVPGCGAPIVWSPDSRTVLTQHWAEKDNHTYWRWYDRVTGQPTDAAIPLENVQQALRMPDGKLLVKVWEPDSDRNKVRLFDPDLGKVLWEQVSPVQRHDWIESSAFS